MDEIEVLFENRAGVGKKIEEIIREDGITKTFLCESAGISRPTLDKMIAGKVTNITNFRKHLSHICDALGGDYDVFLYKRTDFREMRESLHLPLREIAAETGIPESRLRNIEHGEDASVSEYRDIALALGTGTNVLRNQVYFERMNLGLNGMHENEYIDDVVGSFWGHVGVLLSGSKEYLWYPITDTVHHNICQSYQQSRLIIPCMNNRVLFINMDHIKSLYLLYDACDSPDNANWDPDVSEGEIPLVIYEALDDYFNGKQDMSEHFAEKMKSLVNLYGWNEETVYKENFGTDIYYSDGQIQHVNIEYGNNEDLSEETDLVYTENDESLYSKIIYFIEIDGEEHMIHMNHIAMIVMPLLTVEETINKLYL